MAAETVGDEATVIFDPLNGSMYGMATFGTLVKVRDYSDAGDYADGWALYRSDAGLQADDRLVGSPADASCRYFTIDDPVRGG